MRIRPEYLGVLALIGTAVLWGSNHVAARASNQVVPLAAFVFWRWTLAVLPMLALSWPSIRRHRALIRDNLRDLCFIGTIGVGVFSVLLIGGAYYSLAIEIGIINATTPAWVAVIGLLKGDERLSATQWSGLAIAFLGTLLIISQGNLSIVFSMEARPGNIMALAGAIVFAWFSLRLKRYSGRLPAFTLTTVTAAFGTAIVALPYYLVSTLVLGSVWFATPPDQTTFGLLVIAYVAIGPTMLGNACYVYGLSVIGPQRAAAFLYLSPIASSVLAVLLIGESLHRYHFAGYALIVAGLVLVNTSRRSSARPGPVRR